MKMITREIRPSGRCIYRLGGVKLFSFKVKPVGRISASGRPILVIRIPNDGVGLFCHYNCSLGGCAGRINTGVGGMLTCVRR